MNQSRSFEDGERSGIEKALRHVNAVKQTEAVSIHRAYDNGLFLAAEKHTAAFEACERIEARIRDFSPGLSAHGYVQAQCGPCLGLGYVVNEHGRQLICTDCQGLKVKMVPR